MQNNLIMKIAALHRSNPAVFHEFLQAFYEDTTEMAVKAISAPPDQLAKMCGMAQAHTILLKEFTDALVNADKIKTQLEAQEARKQRK